MIVNYAKIVDRLERLRKALLFSFVAVLATATIIYIRADILIGWLVKPLGTGKLVYLSPMEGLMTKIQIALVTSTAFCIPFILWQFVRMAAPLLNTSHKRTLYKAIPLASLLFVSGAAFGYVVLIPVTLNFLLETGQVYMTATLSAGKYVSFVTMLSMAMGVLFQLPLLMAVLARIGILTSYKLKRTRKYAYLGIILLTAFVTPTPDIFTLFVSAVPVLLLYEAGILAIVAYEKSQAAKKSILQEE